MIDRERLLAAITEQIRPKLDKDQLLEDGYNCCGCSTYEQIVEDIERLIRELPEREVAPI